MNNNDNCNNNSDVCFEVNNCGCVCNVMLRCCKDDLIMEIVFKNGNGNGKENESETDIYEGKYSLDDLCNVSTIFKMNETIDEAKQMIYEICKRNTPLINKDTQNTSQLNFQITDNIYGKEKIIKLTLNQLIQPNNKHLNTNNTHILLSALTSKIDTLTNHISSHNTTTTFPIDVIKSLITETLSQITTEHKQTITSLLNELTLLKQQNIMLTSKLSSLESTIQTAQPKVTPLLLSTQSSIITSQHELIQLAKWIYPHNPLKATLLYRATRDGDSIQTFHSKCDDQTPTLTIIQTTTNKRFGGYTERPWQSPNFAFSRVINNSTKNRPDPNAFIFSLDLFTKYHTSDEHKSIWSSFDHGPSFGDYSSTGCDLCIADSCLNNNNSFVNTPNVYRTKFINELNFGTSNFKVKDYEVYLISLI